MTTANDIINTAASFIGVSGTDNEFNTWYWGYHCYDPNQYPWCAAFQSYVANLCGLPCTASASASGFATQFTRVDDSEVQPGDYVVFNWDGRNNTNWCDHIGLVEWFDHGSGYFGTIEGNTGWSAGGEVARVTRYNYGGYFTAFYRPPYDGVESANPVGPGQGWSEPVSGGSGYSPGSPSGGQWQGKLVGTHDTTGSGDDYAGVPGQPMLYLAIGGVGTYQASDIYNGWWPTVDHYDTNDEETGMAGSGSPIDMVRIFDPSVHYQTHNLGGGWNAVMIGTYDTGGSGDDFAGETGVQQDLVRIWREAGEQPEYNVYS